MDIAIIGGATKKQIELKDLIRTFSNQVESLNIFYYELDGHEGLSISPNINVVFFIIENSKFLHRIKELIDLGRELSVIIVSNNPDYALESIRLKIEYYILYPFEEKEVKEALYRSGVIA